MAQKKELNIEQLDKVSGGYQEEHYTENHIALSQYLNEYKIETPKEEGERYKDYLFYKNDTEWFFGRLDDFYDSGANGWAYYVNVKKGYFYGNENVNGHRILYVRRGYAMLRKA